MHRLDEMRLVSTLRSGRTSRVRFILLSCALGAFALLSPLFGVASSTNTQTIVANADASVTEAHPNSNDGSDPDLRVDGTSPVTNAYLRFDVSGVTGSIDNATLRLYVENGTHVGFDVHGVADSSWNESAITWSNAPSIGPSVAYTGSVDKGQWASIDVTQLVQGKTGPVSMAITTPVSEPLVFGSREDGDPPVLVVETATTPPADTTPPSISGQPMVGKTLTASPGDWTGTDPISVAYQWQRCDSGGANCSAISGATGSSFVVPAGDLGATLRVAVTATNSAGSATASSPATPPVTAPVVPDTTAPSAPTGLAVGTVTQTSVPLSWTASTDNVGVTGYDLLVNGTKVTTTTSTSHTFSGLTCGTSYTLGVDAFDAAGNHSSISTANATTAACSSSDTTAPSAPTGLTVGTATQTSVPLSWTASTDNVGVTGYDLLVNGTRVLATTSTSHTFSGLTCGTSYTLGVDAFDAAGNHSNVAPVTAATSACSDTTAPSMPTGLTLGSTTQNSIALSWTASTDNVGVAGYDVLLNGSKITTTGSTGYTFSSLTCGTKYTLGVDAFDAAGNRSNVASINASTSACPDTTAPSMPTGLTVGSTSSNSIALSWTASTDNVGVTGYDLLVNGTKVASATSTTYTFSGLSCGTSYTLGVDAFDAAGNHSSASSVTGTTAACSSSSGYQHVVWVVMENHSYSQIIGNTVSAPYINELAQLYGSATQMFAESHPSLPNYIAMTSGSTQGITDDSGPSSHPLNVGNIFTQTGSNGRSLEEAMPSNCYKGDSGNYAVRHNPGVYYTNYTQCGTQNVPLGSTPDLSAAFTFITPNLCHDMHSNSC